MRKAKRITDHPQKEKFSKSEKELLELIAQIIVEIVISDDDEQTQRMHKKLSKPRSNPSL